MSQELFELISTSAPLLTGIAITMFLAWVKAIPGFPVWMLPLVAFTLGAIIYPALRGWTAQNIILGVVIGGFAVGAHQGVKQSIERFKPNP